MRRARVDDNQREVVASLRGMGCTVQHLHAVGQGCPDILVGFRNRNFLIEIKDGSKPPSARKLKPQQQEWHDAWKGQVATVNNLDEAKSVVGVYG